MIESYIVELLGPTVAAALVVVAVLGLGTAAMLGSCALFAAAQDSAWWRLHQVRREAKIRKAEREMRGGSDA